MLDMGLAKFSQDEQSLSSVHKDSVVGTADYLAPEQAVNSSKVDVRADIYGLGGTLYFLLTGHPPFPEGTLTERLLKHQREEPKSIFEDRSDAPATLVDICRRMMMKNPDERIQSAVEVAEQLRHWLAGRGYDARSDQAGRGPNPGENRWQQLAGNSTPPMTDQLFSTGDTLSADQEDTNPMGSHDEDLTLAPIDDDAADPSTSSSDATEFIRQESLDEQVLSQIEEEIGTRTSTSGSLVDLLHDQSIASASATGILLRKKRPAIPVWMWALSGAAVVLVIAIFLAIILL